MHLIYVFPYETIGTFLTLGSLPFLGGSYAAAIVRLR